MVKNKEFIEWIKSKASAQQWDAFHRVLGVSSKKMTRLANGTDKWTKGYIQKIADHFEVHWYEDIVVPFGVGAQDITIDDMRNMGGVQVSPLPRSA